MERIASIFNKKRPILGKGWWVGFLLLAMSACESIDCTINNIVTCNYGFYNSEGTAVAIGDTLTVTAEGTDSILYNSGTAVSQISLPMSYGQEADTLHFRFRNGATGLYTDITIRVSKSNRQHFESPDCPTAMFHELTGVDYDGVPYYVDSVVIHDAHVNYDAQENIKIYLHTAD